MVEIGIFVILFGATVSFVIYILTQLRKITIIEVKQDGIDTKLKEMDAEIKETNQKVNRIYDILITINKKK